MTLPLSYTPVDIGSSADDGTGDSPRASFSALNDSIEQLYETPSLPYLDVTASKTLALTDIGVRQWVNNASARTLTIPPNSSVAFPVGTSIPGARIGAGTVTITADTGVTLNGVSTGSTTVTSQYGAFALEKIGTDAWIINGAVEDVA